MARGIQSFRARRPVTLPSPSRRTPFTVASSLLRTPFVGFAVALGTLRGDRDPPGLGRHLRQNAPVPNGGTHDRSTASRHRHSSHAGTHVSGGADHGLAATDTP